jgi:hypothetical protein
LHPPVELFAVYEGEIDRSARNFKGAASLS